MDNINNNKGPMNPVEGAKISGGKVNTGVEGEGLSAAVTTVNMTDNDCYIVLQLVNNIKY